MITAFGNQGAEGMMIKQADKYPYLPCRTVVEITYTSTSLNRKVSDDRLQSSSDFFKSLDVAISGPRIFSNFGGVVVTVTS